MIELNHVTFAYGEQPILREVSLTVEAGQKVGIVGESGCGKSTLLRLIAGLYRPTGGSVLVDGESEPARITSKVSIVMQTPMLLPLSILENITMGHAYSDEWIAYVCEAANLKKWIDTLPNGLDTYLGDRADELSGGQAQRIAIARAMCKNAKVLLLDEPTSALDGENAASVLEATARFGADKTVLHVTHRPEHLAGYDRVLKMENGRLTEA
ncbi:MAG: ATP-binding cassette domain-containing protein [Lachnospiraceae bacterium]|nr:ATP-binding cassette domain-containing protein [Lachnospiraceae bacterium]